MRAWISICFHTLIIIGMASVTPCFAEQSKTPDSPIYFVSLADIHFDPFMYCTSAPCPTALKLKAAPASEWAKIFAAATSRVEQYREETNATLLHSALVQAKKQADAKHAQFVVILGDFIRHGFHDYYLSYTHDQSRAGYQAFVKKTFDYLTLEIARTFPGLDVYSVVGNNDSYVDDYVMHPHGRFFADQASAWSSLIHSSGNRASMRQAFPAGGYYSVTVPGQPNLRLIILNSVLFSNHAVGKGLDKGAEEELNWLHEQLRSVQEQRQKAIIAMHIPIGIDVYASLKFRLFTLIEFWESKYKARFEAELQQFSPEITAILTGHLHSDAFQLIKLSNANTIPLSVTPSISPIFGNNPGFKVYAYAPSLGQLQDYVTYYYPLSDGHTWETEYEFSQIYQPNCRACPIMQGMNQLQRRGNLAEHYKLYFAVSTNSQPITNKWNPYYWCAIHELAADDYRKCIE